MIEEKKITVPGNWLQVDFHVHSPGSLDFQGIGKDDAGYIWLLEQAKLAGIDVVVITDHNDITGYAKLLEIESDLLSTKRTLERTNSQIPESVLTQISLFEQVAILPGTELDVYPNLHLIVIFDPQKKVNDISTFLSNAGYTPDVRAKEDTSKFSKWNLEQALQESEKFGAIAIAAHVDSDKGLYDATKKWGQNRILAFCNDNLYGMEFINPVAKDQIENIMKAPNYARNTRLAFVQSSDFHGKPGQNIGERRTFVRMDDVEKQDINKVFESLKKSLRNPDEMVTAPGRPELHAILRKLDNKPAVETIENEDEKKKLIQLICAYANTEDGTIIIGRNSKGNWTGQSESSQHEFDKKIRSVISSSLSPTPSTTIQVYPFYASKYIATIRVKKHQQICAVSESDNIYILESGKPKQASSKEIVEIVESRLIERYSHLSVTARLSEMSQKLLGIEDSIDILPIVRKIDNVSIPMRAALIPPVFGAKIDDENANTFQFVGNGLVDGNIIVLPNAKPRSDDHYLRVSAPIGNYNVTSELKFDEKSIFSGEKLIIVPGGGVYYDNHENIIVACYTYTPIIFTETNTNYTSGLKFITAYLKSSVAIWYAERCLGSHDLRKSSVYQNLPIPNKVDPACQEMAEKLIDDIIKLEDEFLKAETLLYQEYKDKLPKSLDELFEASRHLTDDHNISANKLIGKVDKLFYDLFGFSTKDIEMIEQVLKSLNFANLSEQIAIN